MNSTAQSTLAHPATSADQEERLRHLPAGARAAFEQFQASGDPATLDPVLLAILEDFIPRTHAVPLAELPGNTRLIGDLGFESLSITEVVFFAEDLFNIRISNKEMMQVRTLDDLRGFIHGKAAARASR